MRTVLHGVGQLAIMKPRPDMSDEEATVEALIDGCTLYGSTKTMLDKLVAFREEVGPFGTLLMTGVDWLGPNEAWERQSMQLMAEEVMPRFQQQCWHRRQSEQSRSRHGPLTATRCAGLQRSDSSIPGSAG